MPDLTEREIRALAVVVSQAQMQMMLAEPRPGLAFIQSAVDLALCAGGIRWPPHSIIKTTT